MAPDRPTLARFRRFFRAWRARRVRLVRFGLAARRRLLRRVAGQSLMLGLAAAVGLLTGLFAVALIAGVRIVQALAFGSLPAVPALLVVPLLGGLVVGAIAWRLPEIAGAGVTPVMRAIALHGGRMPVLVAPAKLVASAISLGTGASGGRESPIVQIGGGIASTLGRVFALDDEQMRTLIAAAAGAGIAASFNAPLTGIFFAVEIIIGGYVVRSLQTVVVACVVASVTAREIVGAEITYQLADPPVFRDARELVFYVLLGAAAAVIGIAFARAEHFVAVASRRVRVPPPVRTGVGAGFVGLIALAVPLVLGSGEHLPASVVSITDPVERLLSDGFGEGASTVAFLVLLLVAKLLATSVAIGTGSSVGSFSPALYMGAALGAAFGHVTNAVLRNVEVEPNAFALVGGAAVLAGAVRAPLTAILLAFELTNDYAMVLPLMLSTGIATFVADRMDRESLYTRPLRDEGIVYAEPQGLDLMQTVLVREVMSTDTPTVPASMPLSRLLDMFAETRHHGFVVVDEHNRLVGVVTLDDLARPDRHALEHEPTAAQLATSRVVTVTPSDPVFRALRRMAAIDVGRLPVVADDDRSKVVGVMRRADVVSAYQRAVNRRIGVQHSQQASRLRDLGGVTFVELSVESDSAVAGKAVRDVTWPGRTIVTSVRRDGEVLLPQGDTVLEPHDELVILTDASATEALRELVAGTSR